MSNFLDMELKIAKEVINESKRKGKIYGYLDTIRGAGKYKNSKIIGGGKGWTNWITNTDNYNSDMAKRIVDTAKIGVTKDEATAPIPSLSDINKLTTINKMFDDLRQALNIFNDQLVNYDDSKRFFNERRINNLITSSDDKQKKKEKEIEKIIEKRNAETGSINLSDISSLSDETEKLRQNEIMDYQKLNEGGIMYSIIDKWNRLTNYLTFIVNYKSLNISDQNKLKDKFNELIPLIERIVTIAPKYFIDYDEESEDKNVIKLKIINKKMITQDYTPVSDTDVLTYLQDNPNKDNIKKIGKPDVSGNIRRPFNPNFGLDNDPDDDPNGGNDDDDDYDGYDDGDYRGMPDQNQKANDIAQSLMEGARISDVMDILRTNPDMAARVIKLLLGNNRNEIANKIYSLMLQQPLNDDNLTMEEIPRPTPRFQPMQMPFMGVEEEIPRPTPRFQPMQMPFMGVEEGMPQKTLPSGVEPAQATASNEPEKTKPKKEINSKRLEELEQSKNSLIRKFNTYEKLYNKEINILERMQKSKTATPDKLEISRLRLQEYDNLIQQTVEQIQDIEKQIEDMK
jgi:hypothetical protein